MTPLDVCLLSLGIPHDGRTLQEHSLGGSETAAVHVSKALAKRGHYVTVFSPCPERKGQRGGLMDGVVWLPIEAFSGYVTAVPHDVLVVSRDLNAVRAPALTKLRYLWCHDLALKRHRAVMGSAMWNTDALYVLSAYQRQQYREIHGLPDDRLFVTRNGVDTAAIAQAIRGSARDTRKLVYGSRPERGLETAIRVMDTLARRGSKLRLEVSWYDHQGLAPELQGYYAQLRTEAEKRPNISLKGALTQPAWHKQLASASALIEPGSPDAFRHIYAIVVAEAQACGTPTVCAGKGALPETLNGAGIAVGDEATDYGNPAYVEAFADAVQRLCEGDRDVWTQCHEQARRNTPGLDWSGVAEQWEADWLARLAEQTSDRWRMARHFQRIGEREVAV